jgi:CheY-like chemotaxis protein
MQGPVGLSVLIVDDDPLCLKVMERMLTSCQYKGAPRGSCGATPVAVGRCRASSPTRSGTQPSAATTCTNGTTALQMLRCRDHTFDLALIDCYMPGRPGGQTTMHARAVSQAHRRAPTRRPPNTRTHAKQTWTGSSCWSRSAWSWSCQ